MATARALLPPFPNGWYALAEGDGPVCRYRQWARQFYPAAEASTLA